MSITHGKKPDGILKEATGFAERTGYRRQENTSENLWYDHLIFNLQSSRFVKVRQTRYRIDPESFYEDLFPDDLQDLRVLPFPPFILPELRLRTRNERAWCRLIVCNFAVTEIEW